MKELFGEGFFLRGFANQDMNGSSTRGYYVILIYNTAVVDSKQKNIELVSIILCFIKMN